MQKKKIAFIINPISGTKSKKDLPDLISTSIDLEIWESPVVVYTERAGHGKELARKYASDNFDVVVACGGDGTMNEVASGLVGTSTAFGIVPYGSGNGLARHCGFSMIPKKALEQINAGASHPMDYGMVEDVLFFCTCGTGFDAHISHAFANAKGRGFFNYLKLTLREYFSYKPYTYHIKTENGEMDKTAFVVTFANASQYGNNAYIAPSAKTDDGLMDICLLSPFPMYAVPKLAWQLFRKTLDKSKYVTTVRAKEAILSRSYEGEFHVDGEPILLGKDIQVRIFSGQLSVWI